MTITQLEYCLAVYKEGHFGRAAKACFVTQPSLSVQIQKLEQELGVTLFNRNSSPITPTVEGKVFIKQAQIILKESKKAKLLMEQSKEEISGDLTLAVIPTLSPFVIPLFAQSFISHFPKVNLKILELTTEQIIKALKNDEVDAGILVTPLYENSIEEKQLYYEPFYLFAHPDHHLLKKKRVKQDDLDLDEIWLLNKGNCFRDQVINICQNQAKEIKNPINFESGNFETLKNMVLGGSSYTLLPQMAIESLNAQHEKLVRPFNSPIPTREVSLVHHKSNVKSRIIDALEEEILGAIPDKLIDFNPKKQDIIDI